MCESSIMYPKNHNPSTCRGHSPNVIIKVLWNITLSRQPHVGGLRSSCLYLGLGPSSNHIQCGSRPSHDINKLASTSNHAELQPSTSYGITCIIIIDKTVLAVDSHS